MKAFVDNLSDRLLRVRILQALGALLLAGVVQSFLTSGRHELPQKGGESLLALVSEDTRQVLSSVMLGKVDDYFHGGAKAENCAIHAMHASDDARHAVVPSGSGDGAEHGEEEHHEHDHAGCSDEMCTEHHHHHESAVRSSGGDPFKWINQRIHAQEHRHLKKSRSVELLPWIAASVKASPHNIQAYEIGSYVLSQMTDNPQLAVDFLEEGVRNNPGSVELETSLGEIYFNSLKDAEHAAVHFGRALQKSLRIEGPLTEDEKFLRLRVSFYLGIIARQRGDLPALQAAFDRAFDIRPENVMTRTLATWLDELEEKKR